MKLGKSQVDNDTLDCMTLVLLCDDVGCMNGLLQVEVVTRQSAGGGAIAIHRYMAAGSCMGVEAWQGPGLLGNALEQQLTALVHAFITYWLCLAGLPHQSCACTHDLYI